MNSNCPRCESVRWMTGVKSVNHVFVVPANENHDFFSAGGVKGHSDVSANVCADCGFTEFYTTDPESVWREWMKKTGGR